MNTVARTRILAKTTTGVCVDDAVIVAWLIPVDGQVRALPTEEKPVTAWEVAAELGASYINQVSAVLDRLTTEGSLARFRAGLNNYYALPKVAVTSKEPTLITVICDSLKCLFLGCRYAVTGRLNGTSKCSPKK